nr:M13 family metallopeptidase [uncultured Methanospirillum sp.]
MRKTRVLQVIILLFCLFQTGSADPISSSSGKFTFNTSIDPGDDLFSYVNDGWVAEHPLPANKSSYTTFTAVNENTEDQLHTLFNKEAADYASGKESLIGKFYASGMDNETINNLSISSLSDEIARINSISTRQNLFNVSSHLIENGVAPFFLYYADQDPTNSTWVIPQVEQGGLGLPERDYYFRNDTETTDIQKAYRQHIKNVFTLLNYTEADADEYAGIVYNLEKEMASSQYTTVENRDPVNTTHITQWSDLSSQYPNIDWETLTAINGSGHADRINLHQLTTIQKLDQMFGSVPLEDWKVFLIYKLVDSLSPCLSDPFESENFDFYKHILNGVESPEPRWKRVLTVVNFAIPDEVGKKYVQAYFNADEREKARSISHAIRATLRERIANLTWMSDTTKQAAIEKMDAIVEKIGYPDVWIDYSGLHLTNSYTSNVLEAGRFSMIYGPNGLEKIGKPVDRTTWLMSPQTVNAYYNPTLNEIVFPAAILQPPFFDPNASDSTNYGGIGTVIGHEMTHGFDDQGRQFDKDGNIRDWWNANDSARFQEQADRIVDQYNHFEIIPGVFVNGNLTLGENIADFGGLTLAYHAWEENGKDAGEMAGSDNITPAQKVFLSFVRIWSGVARDEFLRSDSYTNPHPWVKFRSNGPPFNIPEFYQAFPSVGPDNALYRTPEQRPVIW